MVQCGYKEKKKGEKKKMKIIDMKEEFIVADHVVTVQFENHYKAVTVYASDSHFHKD